jgi:hypothetical protein
MTVWGPDRPAQLDGLPGGHAVAHRPGDREAHAAEMEQGGVDLEAVGDLADASYSTMSPVIHRVPCAWPSQPRANPMTSLAMGRLRGGPWRQGWR